MDRTNEFAFKIATPNGTGSASANSLLMQAIFRMGIPVTGKNMFPSNIQGLPTWYEIRVSGEGYTARPSVLDLVVALNPTTHAHEDLTILGVPFGQMCVEAFEGDRDRTLMRNIVYAGTLAALLGFDMDVVAAMLDEKFARKKRLLDANQTAI